MTATNVTNSLTSSSVWHGKKSGSITKKSGSTTKKFRSVNANQGLVSFVCPDCHFVFGLQSKFLDLMELVNFHCLCPYCGKEGGIES